MAKAIKVRDLTLGEGLLNLPASFKSISSLESLLPLYKDAGFYIVEPLCGSVASAILSEAKENPLDRLGIVSTALSGTSLTGVSIDSRGVFGHQPLPTDVRMFFLNRISECGVGVVRIGDMLNDLENMQLTISLCRQRGIIADSSVRYAVEPPVQREIVGKKSSFFSRLFKVEREESLPDLIFPDNYYTAKSKELERAGAGIVSLDDMDGLLPSSRLFILMPRLKHAVKCYVSFHPDNAFGDALANLLTAVIKGVDIIDTNIWWAAGGSSAPALELISLFCGRLGIDLDVDMDAVGAVRKKIGEAIGEGEPNGRLSNCGEFETLLKEMPRKMNENIDSAIEAAGVNDEETLRRTCREIEEYFGFRTSACQKFIPQLPTYTGEFISTTLSKLNMDALYDDAVDLIPKVRHDAGEPPMSGPVGKIIAGQAVALSLDRYRNASDYSNRTDEFHSLIKGVYGHTPVQIEPEFRERITGSTEEVSFSEETYKAPANPIIEQLGNQPLAATEDERLLLHLFQQEAPEYLKFKKNIS